METIFTVVLVILGILAVSDLVVGVSNDAVNFLNSAIGSNAAPRYVIMIVATVGILLGSTFSSGMMEVARSGIFHPQMFTFEEIMTVFLAVMFTDVILLDLFNSLGMPTSTTVSLVFELLGSAVCVALIKISNTPGAELAQYINSAKALAIISGILISVVVSFVCGSVVMFVTRMIFSFNYKRSFKYLGSIWCGIALTSISYFVIFKGLKSTTLVSKETLQMLNENVVLMVGIFFVAWTAIMALLQHLFKVSIIKLTILAGTFALALAFAGNDLVNFIGVFMGGFDAYNIASVTGDTQMLMGELAKPVTANMPILIAAGVIMSITLWTSNKAKTVTETEINLARQSSDGAERFNSTPVSRAIVKLAVLINKGFLAITPAPVAKFIDSRFTPIEEEDADERVSFDHIRATVNLTVAALLISLATSLKLPLSTTYVTFMVAMGSSLSDKAWGRESAVYRITGVLAVIAGWFLTAIIAFSIACLVALVLSYGGAFGIAVIAILCGSMVVFSSLHHKKQAKKEKTELELATKAEEIVVACQNEVCSSMKAVIDIYNKTLNGVYTEDERLLRKMMKESQDLVDAASERKHSVHKTLMLLSETEISTGHYYVQVTDYINEVAKALYQITQRSFSHINNNHAGFSDDQINDLKEVVDKVTVIYGMINHMLTTAEYNKIDETLHLRDTLFEELAQVVKRQLTRVKKGQTSTRASILFLDIISETKTMILQSRNLLKSQKHFVSK